jgi:hypothetical protein
VARAGFEPATPRFSVVGSAGAKVVALHSRAACQADFGATSPRTVSTSDRATHRRFVFFRLPLGDRPTAHSPIGEALVQLPPMADKSLPCINWFELILPLTRALDDAEVTLVVPAAKYERWCLVLPVEPALPEQSR